LSFVTSVDQSEESNSKRRIALGVSGLRALGTSASARMSISTAAGYVDPGRRVQAQDSVFGQFGGALAGSLGKLAPG
jgi:hypothetical protein